MKQIASPGSMHDTGCFGLGHWDSQRGGTGREEGWGSHDVMRQWGYSGLSKDRCLEKWPK